MTRSVTADPTSGVRGWLRAEGIAAFGAAALLYASLDLSWVLFVALFFAPDLSFIGYMAGARTGSAIYNLAHSYVVPLLVASVLVSTGRALALPLIWIAHIGFDRMLGYGLKLPSGFTDTHLGRIGRAKGGP